MTQYVIGYGFGRCGTQSLAQLLHLQPYSCFSHELHGLHWLPIFSRYPLIKKALQKRGDMFDFVGDVNYAWVQYIPQLVENFPDVKFIHIWRDKEASVESFWDRNQDRINAINTPSVWGNDTFWHSIYPFFGYPPSKDQVANTYDVFHKIAETIMVLYSTRTYTIKMESLNNPDSIKKLLDYVGIPENKQVVKPIQANKGGQSTLDLFVVPNERFAQKHNYSMKAGITLEASK